MSLKSFINWLKYKQIDESLVLKKRTNADGTAQFVVDSDNTPEDLKIFQLRPTVSGFNTNYSVVTSFSLSSIYPNMDEDKSHLSNDGRELIVDLTRHLDGVESLYNKVNKEIKKRIEGK